MGVLIDTSVLIPAEREGVWWDQALGRSVELDEDEAVAMSAVTASELLHGVHRLKGVAQARAGLFVNALLDEIPVLPFDAAVARVHAMLAAACAAKGAAVGAHDLIIAATAVAHGYDVATRDRRSFSKIEDLRVRQW
jgi:predicted nucleic acid-binding protein